MMLTEPSVDFLRHVCTPCGNINQQTLEEVILLALEIAREGREGRKIGTLFVIGDTDETLIRSRCLILDPLWYHPNEMKHISDPNLRETLKELAQLDGAFIVSDDGIVLSACRFLNALAEDVDLPLGLGSRHMAAASITAQTETIAVVVSESSVVRVFENGGLISEILPELWLFGRYSLHLSRPYSLHSFEDVTVVSKDEAEVAAGP